MNIDQLERARKRLAARYWEYSYALSKLVFYQEVEGMGTIGVDQFWRVYWDPALEWGKTELETVILHELGHALGEHHDRWKEMCNGTSFSGVHIPHLHPMISNIGGDAEINDDLLKLPWTKFPTMGDVSEKEKKKAEGQSGGITPATLGMPEGLPMENYIEAMYDRMKDGKDPITGEDMQEGDGDGDGEGIPIQMPGKGGDCGSIAGGGGRPWENPDNSDGSGLSDAEKQQVVDETEERVAAQIHGEAQPSMDQADTSSGKQAGDEARTPMLIDRDKVTAKVNHKYWKDAIQKELWQHLRHSKRSWEQPHRRIDGLPGKQRFPQEAVFLDDISGSINELSVQRTFEIQDRFYGRGLKLSTVVCDTQAHVVTDRKARYSGGGTDLGAGLHLIAKQFPHASVVIVVTDGYTPWPDTNPCNCPVVVFSWGEKGPEWAKSVPMPGLTEDQLVKPSWP